MLDLIIKGARVVDGSGNKSQQADVGVRNGEIVALGRVSWDPTLSPSVALGVTTAVMGNCGFGIAPCPPPLRETLLRNLSVVEGMDVDALLAGTRWDFETFPQYLDMIARRKPLGNVAVLAQHSTIRNAVMGEEASTRKVPSATQMEQMR